MNALWRGEHLQRLRLVSGLVLFTFATTHFLNHACGLISVDLMHDVQQWRQLVTRSLPGTVVLVSALVVHAALALFKLARRTTLRMPLWEALQLVLGLLIPFFLLPHIVNTRIAHLMFGVNDVYLYELAKLWPESALIQSFLLLIVWVHGCIGLHFWLRLNPTYRRLQPLAMGLAIAVPLAALGGFMVAGRGVALLMTDPDTLSDIKSMTNWPNEADSKSLAGLRTIVRVEFAILLAVVAGYAILGMFARMAGPKVKISYAGGPDLTVPEGPTLLEISRKYKVPHASICGGRARCSTCRVRIEAGSTALPPPVFPETVTLGSIGAPDNVRLACQIHPQGTLFVTRLLREEMAGPESIDLEETNAQGVEKTLAVMFVDMRAFTRLAEKRMPFDIVYILNEFFGVVGAAITANGGRIDKFIGDGLLAVFGEKSGVEIGCRQALRTARAIDLALDHVNAKLEAELGRSLEVGMGVDAGPLVLGRIGYGDAIDFTVIGSAVNVASRLEGLSKDKGFQIMLSRAVAREAGWEPTTEFKMTTSVRGVAEPIEVIGIPRGRDLPARILAISDNEDAQTRAPQKIGSRR